MFSGLTEEMPVNTGKKIYGLPSRREPEFSIGWSNNNQLNDYQMRKSKNKEVTGKITTQAIIQGQDVYPQRPLRAYDPTPNRDYTPPSYENMTQEELEKMMQRYEEYRGVPSRKEDRLSENSGIEKRAPIRPRESMKDIIYNGIGIGEQAYQKAGSRVQFVVSSSSATTQTTTIITLEEIEMDTYSLILPLILLRTAFPHFLTSAQQYDVVG